MPSSWIDSSEALCVGSWISNVLWLCVYVESLKNLKAEWSSFSNCKMFHSQVENLNCLEKLTKIFEQINHTKEIEYTKIAL